VASTFPGAVREAGARDAAQVRDYRLAHAGWTPGTGRHFNQIELPDYWEITADGLSGKVATATTCGAGSSTRARRRAAS
jgi:hypothetical protein